LWPPFEFLLVFIVLMLSKPEAITILKDWISRHVHFFHCFIDWLISKITASL
jgi:hypothetical protein